ncbi:MAG: DsbA family protein [Gammaproteobacteria bacterium]|nr:DsbA family protein [Gammaproteobacteria bacterium]
MKQTNQWKIIAGMVAGLALIAVIIMFLPGEEPAPTADSEVDAHAAALASEHSPSIGDAGAKVHMVEFLDPACGTCALFYPMVKQWLDQSEGDLRLSIRHLAFHQGAEYAVRVLEASRNQDKYWETLEALLASQARWVTNHVVQPDRIAPVLAGIGLDMERLAADMNSPEVTQRIEKDQADAIYLKVTATPGYFVNGRPLPSFGAQQLLDLVREELSK